jgi:hypothetical protein
MSIFEGTVSRDCRLSVFFIKLSSLGIDSLAKAVSNMDWNHWDIWDNRLKSSHSAVSMWLRKRNQWFQWDFGSWIQRSQWDRWHGFSRVNETADSAVTMRTRKPYQNFNIIPYTYSANCYRKIIFLFIRLRRSFISQTNANEAKKAKRNKTEPKNCDITSQKGQNLIYLKYRTHTFWMHNATSATICFVIDML